MDSPPFAFSASFQLTSSRRGWRLCNSWFGCRRGISTHILTKRMTRTLHGNQQRIVISTHILTKRMTTRLFSVMTLNLFQLTSSRRGWHYCDYADVHALDISTHILTKRMTATRWNLCREVRDFNSHPHEEDDCFPHPTLPVYRIFQLTSSRRGWPKSWSSVTVSSVISTHILTKRMTYSYFFYNSFPIFQLTSSRRGWPILQAEYLPAYHFNSHPHEEDDYDRRCWFCIRCISTHILTKRMT